MGLFRGLVSLLVLFVLQRSNTSLVRLNDNGYEDLVIAIDPGVPEDGKLIEQLKDMVTTASTYLFEATQKRFFFKNVSILIPKNWEGSPEYKRPKHESYDQADVRVAAPALPGRDEPYTRQFTECGEKAEYIHFTPDFVLGKKQNEYGPSGRLFVHEWAHLRWGVFDEYNEEKPFYSGKSKKIEATRCSTGITGKNSVYKCQGGSCITRSCKRNSTTNLYEKDCQFFPNKVQTEKASIMFMQSIDSVLEFCNAENHNQEAPSLQNIKCNFRSTWEVISNSEDFKNTTPMAAPPPPPVFSLLRITSVVILPFSSRIMAKGLSILFIFSKNQLLVLLIFSIVSFVSISLISALILIISCLLLHLLLFCSSFSRLNAQIDGSEIVLLTDGEDSTTGRCVDAVKQSGAVIHLIALGPSAERAVIEMSTETGGKHIYASDNAENNGLIDAFGALTSENADPTQKSLQLESKGLTLDNDSWMNDTVIIDSTVGKDTFFLVTWEKQPPSISLWNPNGTLTEAFTQDTVSKMAYLSIPGTAQVGTWTYSLQAKANTETLTMTVTSRAASSSVPPITVNAKMNKDTNSFPSPMIIYAQVLQGYLPILGASVTAIIESNDGKTQVLELLDNGAGADSFKDDGVYSRYFTTYSESGRYNLKVRAHGGTDSARRSLRHPLNRAAYIPGWVVDGVIEVNPPRPETNEDTQTILENFSRTASGGAFVVSNVPGTTNVPLPDLFPPSQITDLDATPEGDQINLTWTAPGDNFDVGTVREYIIRISGNITDLRDNFDDALQVNTTNLSPKEANSKETFAFKPGNISEENITHIFIAIQSVDKSNLTSKVSNIAQVALFIPQVDPVPDAGQPNPNPGESHPNHNSGVNISTVVLSVVGSVVVVSIILSTTICILKKRNSSRRPRTEF
uniref:Calcium-activated chloride channel N-terminal domain-containing protein n=1 Tax=Spermophilus dauricus TaxID=99837 RepID=A0A8C9QI41_SPEDA